MKYGGVVIVDGRVVTHSFLDALSEGLVDVPLIMGNMQYENDGGPPDDFSRYSQQEWDDFLSIYFQPWGDDVGKGIAER